MEVEVELEVEVEVAVQPRAHQGQQWQSRWPLRALAGPRGCDLDAIGISQSGIAPRLCRIASPTKQLAPGPSLPLVVIAKIKRRDVGCQWAQFFQHP